jgi:hypothetical protein
MSRTATLGLFGATVILLSACATQRYGRATPVSPGESAALTCEQIALEIEKTEFFVADVQRQRSSTSGAHVLGALGDFGIGNVMEGDAAEESGMNRLRELRVLQHQKGCTLQ